MGLGQRLGLRVRVQGQRLGLGVRVSVKGWVWGKGQRLSLWVKSNVGFRVRVRLGLRGKGCVWVKRCI